MILRTELRKLVRARLKDAEVLGANRRYAGAVYLCGYTVELALKERVCKTLGWQGFPETRQEMQGYRSFMVHDLDVLLHLSGVEQRIKTQHLADWSLVAKWDPQLRYQPIRQATRQHALDMLRAVQTLTRVL
jgi:hypothetical protein